MSRKISIDFSTLYKVTYHGLEAKPEGFRLIEEKREITNKLTRYSLSAQWLFRRDLNSQIPNLKAP